MPVSIIGIVRNSLKFTAVKAIAAAAMFGVTLYAATVLTPAEYGIYGVLSLWLTYVGLATPGIYAAAAREIPVLLGRQKEKDALSVQNVALSAEIIWAIFPTAAIIIAGFLQHDPVLKAGLWIVAGVYLASRLANLLAHINFTRERFNIVAAGELISGIVSPAVVFLCLHWLKVHALVIGPLVAACTVLAYYLVRGRIDFHFTLERQQVMRLAGSGVVLQGLAVVLTAFRIADRTI
ncbi:MAG: hypothetical protein N2506_07340, partial [Dehalococcoidales bacterium]|nr:hypothetical protein [Dehalococcoidales bacterium]